LGGDSEEDSGNYWRRLDRPPVVLLDSSPFAARFQKAARTSPSPERRRGECPKAVLHAIRGEAEALESPVVRDVIEDLPPLLKAEECIGNMDDSVALYEVGRAPFFAAAQGAALQSIEDWTEVEQGERLIARRDDVAAFHHAEHRNAVTPTKARESKIPVRMLRRQASAAEAQELDQERLKRGTCHRHCASNARAGRIATVLAAGEDLMRSMGTLRNVRDLESFNQRVQSAKIGSAWQTISQRRHLPLGFVRSSPQLRFDLFA
jgi:hypothetical protein